MIDDILERINLGNIWIFMTDKCNLDCDYCFFQDRKKKQTIEFDSILTLLGRLPGAGKYDFVLSGGEPLICWDLSKKIIEHLRVNYPQSDITLQSNMLLFDDGKAKVCQKNDVVVEPGIDGSFLSNSRHRKGIDRKRFDRLLENIHRMIKYNLHMGPTMTVHPHEAGDMFENFLSLTELGLNSIEVHPAFLAPWTEKSSPEFIRQYKKIINYERETGRTLVCKEYSMPTRIQLDLVVQPDGYILPNWTYLSFPPKIREQYFIMKVTPTGLEIYSSVLSKYLQRFKEFDDDKKTYRDFSNFNAALVLDNVKDNKMKADFLAYKKLCRRIQKIDQSCGVGKGGVSGCPL